MILVAGGTGTLGSQVVRLLLERGDRVRVLTRDSARAAHLPNAVDVLTGDLRDPAAVAAAVRGCATVVSAVHGFVGPGKPSPEAIDRDANIALIRAAAAAGVQHLVLVSVLGAAPDHPMSLHRAKHAAEQALRASGYEPHHIASGGASDANALEAAGFTCVNLANGTERNHEPTERVSIAALEGMLDVALALLDEAAAV